MPEGSEGGSLTVESNTSDNHFSLICIYSSKSTNKLYYYFMQNLNNL